MLKRRMLKILARKKNWFKQRTRPRMNCEWIGKKHLEKNPTKKIEKTMKIKLKLRM